MKQPEHHPIDALLAFTGHARFTSALAVCIVAMGFLSHTIRSIIGSPGLFAIVAGLAVLAAVSLIARRHELEWRGVLPLSLLVFLGWSALSIFWSSYQWATLGSLVYQFAFAGLALYVALVRDMIQIVRAFGDALRFVLGGSIFVEVLSGLLIDTPLQFIGVAGNLDNLGPVQGLLGTRNEFGLVALIALVTFGTELVTRSVQRGVGIGSLVVAALSILLSQSPVSMGVLFVLGIVSFALLGLRRLKPERRRVWQISLAVAAVLSLLMAYAFRGRILTILDASSELAYRFGLWQETAQLTRVHTIEGWGWIGAWREGLAPFYAIDSANGIPHGSALNAYLDVWFQLGVVGLFSLIALVGLGLARSWVLASQQRSRVFVWPALVLVALLMTSLAESTILVDFGWMTLIICLVKAAEHLSWRRGLPD